MGVRTRELRSNSDDRSWNKIIAWLFVETFHTNCNSAKRAKYGLIFNFVIGYSVAFTWPWCTRKQFVSTLLYAFILRKHRGESLLFKQLDRMQLNATVCIFTITWHRIIKKCRRKTHHGCVVQRFWRHGDPQEATSVLGSLWETWDEPMTLFDQLETIKHLLPSKLPLDGFVIRWIKGQAPDSLHSILISFL